LKVNQNLRLTPQLLPIKIVYKIDIYKRILLLLLLPPLMFSDFLKALHGLICGYKYYESV